MIRLLKWVFAISLILTLAVNMVYGSLLPIKWYLTLFFGLVFLVWLVSSLFARKAFLQVLWLAELMVYFSWELLRASFIVAYEVLTPNHQMEAGIVAVPLDTKIDLELTIFSSLVSLTPGTLSVDVSADKSHLFVHAMYIENGDKTALTNELKNGFERKIIRIFE